MTTAAPRKAQAAEKRRRNRENVARLRAARRAQGLEFVELCLPSSTIARIDELADAQGISRSEAAARLLERV
jgi:hypothetical protein